MSEQLTFLFLFLILTWTTLDMHSGMLDCGYLLSTTNKSNRAKLGCLEPTHIKKMKIIENYISHQEILRTLYSETNRPGD